MISRSAIYAVRAMTYLALLDRDRWALSRQISEKLILPPQFLAKVLGILSSHGLLESLRGRTGGFRLSRSPEEISLLDIVEPFDHIRSRQSCLLWPGICSTGQECPLHETWEQITGVCIDLLGSTTLADVAERVPTSSIAPPNDGRSRPGAMPRPSKGGRSKPVRHTRPRKEAPRS